MYRAIARMILFWVACTSIQAVNTQNPSIAQSDKGMVVSSQHLATQVGVDILQQGGNAIDAAVAMGYALAVVDPCCGNIGGGGFMMIHRANGENIVLNFREKAPAGLKPEVLSAPEMSPYAVVGVPGTVKGLNTALKHYGTLPLRTLVQPAIQLAEEGYVFQPQDNLWFKVVGANALKKDPNVEKIFLKKGEIYQAGDRLVQKTLGKTLRLIASEGESAFYHGKIADDIARSNQKHHGFITHQDLANYTVTVEKPLVCEYRGRSLLLTPLPSAGGIVLCELLKVVEGFPLNAYDPHDVKRLALNFEAIRYVYQDKAQYIGGDLSKIPVKWLLSDAHIADIRQKIRKTMAQKKHPAVSLPEGRHGKSETTAYSVADAKGNVVAVTYTVNGPFGAQVIPDNTGFFLNSELEDFDYGYRAEAYKKMLGRAPNAPAPHARPVSSITQVIMLDERQKPVLVLGTPGGDTIPAQLLNALEYVIDYDQSLEAAINAPRAFFRWLQGKVYLEPELSFKKQAISALGYVIGKGSGCNENGGQLHCGAMNGIKINTHAPRFIGVADWRRGAGMAEGVQ